VSYPHWEMICNKTSKQRWVKGFTLFEQAKACEFVNPRGDCVVLSNHFPSGDFSFVTFLCVVDKEK